jgi:hypothetical protein
MPHLIQLIDALTNFRSLIHQSIVEGGSEGKNAMIRSSRPILNVHEAVKSALISAGIAENALFPPLNNRSPELKLAGSRKQKDQDVCVIPSFSPTEEVLTEGLLDNVKDAYGEAFTERTIVINIRSQISSIQKNFDTMHERTTSEAINLHDRCPKICLGEVYMIAIPEYDERAMKNKEIVFKKPNPSLVLKYIKSFQAINSRKTTEKNFYQYESVCLLIVDFSQTPIKVYDTETSLKEAGLIPQETTVDMYSLSWDNFVPSLLKTYQTRFGA